MTETELRRAKELLGKARGHIRAEIARTSVHAVARALGYQRGQEQHVRTIRDGDSGVSAELVLEWVGKLLRNPAVPGQVGRPRKKESET